MHAWVPVDGGRECGRVFFFFFFFSFFFLKRDQTRISQMTMNASYFPFLFFLFILLLAWLTGFPFIMDGVSGMEIENEKKKKK